MKEKIANGITELVFIIDQSGSMSGLEDDTIGGFNSMIKEQKSSDSGEVLVTTVLFSNASKTIHDRVHLDSISPMTERDYRPSGSTALLDALGYTIDHISDIHKYARPEDVPEHTMFVITTDGMENASRRYNYDRIKKRISQKQEKYGWEFIFVGANIDSFEVSSRMGIRSTNVTSYKNDSAGVEKLYKCLSKPIMAMRENRYDDEDYSTWRDELAEDARR